MAGISEATVKDAASGGVVMQLGAAHGMQARARARTLRPPATCPSGGADEVDPERVELARRSAGPSERAGLRLIPDTGASTVMYSTDQHPRAEPRVARPA